MKKGSLIVAGVVILIVVFAMLFSLQKLVDIKTSGFTTLQKGSTVQDATGPR